MGYSLEDLVDLEKVEAVLKTFYEVTGIPPSITDIHGKVLIGIGWQRACTDFHRVNPETCKRCIESDTVLSKRVNSITGYTAYNCLNGLVEMAVPIRVEGQHLANLFAGQFFFDPPDMEFYRKQAAEFGFDQADYLFAIDEVPIFERGKMERGILFLQGLANLVSEMGLAQIKLAVLNEELEVEVKEKTTQLRDEIKERKKAEAEKVEAGRLQGVLEMAGAASHEFSQPLQALLADATFLEEKISSDDVDVTDALQAMLENAQRLAELVDKVQHVTRHKTSEYSETQRIIDLDKASE